MDYINIGIMSMIRACWVVRLSWSRNLQGLLSQAELFILHFNTSLYDPALRHSSVQFLNYILSGASYYSTSIETVPVMSLAPL